MSKWVLYLLGALVAACICLAIGMAYQHSKIASQGATIASQAQALEGFEKDKAAQEVADNQLQAEKDRIAKERDKAKRDLKDALKGNACTDTQLPDDAKRVLKELYGSKGA